MSDRLQQSLGNTSVLAAAAKARQRKVTKFPDARYAAAFQPHAGGLAVRRDYGVVLGRPRSTPDDLVARVVRERAEGKTAYAIAAT